MGAFLSYICSYLEEFLRKRLQNFSGVDQTYVGRPTLIDFLSIRAKSKVSDQEVNR
jgi:hypothetical protein